MLQVAITEEALDTADKGPEIYELIVAQPVQYAVMDDYNLVVWRDPVAPACLDGHARAFDAGEEAAQARGTSGPS